MLRHSISQMKFKPSVKPFKVWKAHDAYTHSDADTQNPPHIKCVMNSACSREACAEISMTKLPNDLVTISFALILSLNN